MWRRNGVCVFLCVLSTNLNCDWMLPTNRILKRLHCLTIVDTFLQEKAVF